jgi:hypothetical protein
MLKKVKKIKFNSNVLPCLSPRPDTEGRICLSSLESVPVRSEEQKKIFKRIDR